MGRDALHIVLAILALCVAYSANALTKQGYTVGNYQLSKIGCGTWSWGNRFLWGYSEEDDARLQETYEYITKRGVNWFDTADSYGTGSLNGRAEELLGRFERDHSYPSRSRLPGKLTYGCCRVRALKSNPSYPLGDPRRAPPRT